MFFINIFSNFYGYIIFNIIYFFKLDEMLFSLFPIFDKLDEILFSLFPIFDKSLNFSSCSLSFNKILDIFIEFSILFSTDSIFRQYRLTFIYKIYTLIYGLL